MFEDAVVSGSGTVNRFNASFEGGAGRCHPDLRHGLHTDGRATPEAMTQEPPTSLPWRRRRPTRSALNESLKLLATKDKSSSNTTPLSPAGSLVPVAGDRVRRWQGRPESLAADSAITAIFADDGMLSGNAGVTQYSTAYEVSDEDVMSIDAQVVTTRHGGTGGVSGPGGGSISPPSRRRPRIPSTRSDCGCAT